LVPRWPVWVVPAPYPADTWRAGKRVVKDVGGSYARRVATRERESGVFFQRRGGEAKGHGSDSGGSHWGLRRKRTAPNVTLGGAMGNEERKCLTGFLFKTIPPNSRSASCREMESGDLCEKPPMTEKD